MRRELERMSDAMVEEKGLLNHVQAALMLDVSTKRVGDSLSAQKGLAICHIWQHSHRPVLVVRESAPVKAISKAIFPPGNRYLLCQRAMLCRAIGGLASENDLAGFELPLRTTSILNGDA